MKKFALIIICMFMLFSFCACSNQVTEGEIYKKEYREEHTTIMLLPLITSNGKTATTTLIPYFIHYPERYVIFIKAYQNEEWVTEDFYVSKEVYNTVNIGDMFLYDENRGDLKEEPYTKERKTDSV